jgi:hypothetical protein
MVNGMTVNWRRMEEYLERMEDSGAPQCQLLRDGFHRARKEHTCTRCKKGIKPGDTYRSQFWLVDEEPWHDKTCRSCLDEEYEQ